MQLQAAQVPWMAAAGLALVVLVCAVMLGLEKSKTGRLRAALAAAEKELAELKDGPREHEYRLEQFDVLWYPKVTWSPKEKKVLKTAAGVPHCRDCSLPLKAGAAGEPWSCPKCARKAPPTVTDVVVMDQVAKKAADYFQQRFPEIQAA